MVEIMRITRDLVIAGIFLAGLTAGSANAASISYDMDVSNTMPDGFNYLTVTISDSTTTTGDIDFSVVVNSDEFPFASTASNFGMDMFTFNYDSSLKVKTDNIVSIDPSSWNIKADKSGGGGFGKFDFRLAGPGNRTEVLSFSISGVDGDSLSSYAIGYDGTGEAYFAAHVGGYGATGDDSAFFATVVPVPAAVWLFGSGLLGLAGVARRRA